MVRVIAPVISFCLMLFIGTVSSCTGHAHRYTEIRKLDINDSVTVVVLDKSATGTRITFSGAGYPKHISLTPSAYNFVTYQGLVNSIVQGQTTNEGKAIALWTFVKDYTYHCLPVSSGHLPHDPIRLVNSFGSGLCDDRNTALASLFKLAGFNARVVELGGHMVAEVYYNNEWHMFDADLGVYYREHGKVASVAYTSTHPNIAKADFGKGFFADLLTKFTTWHMGYVYASTQNNRATPWQDNFKMDYQSWLELNPADELILETHQLNKTEKIMQAVFLHSLQPVTGTGLLKRKVQVVSKEQVWHETLPYAVKQLNLKLNPGAKGKAQVFYSPDSLHWFYKGTLKCGNKLAFTPVSAENEPCTFTYYLKLVGGQADSLTIENQLLFSGALFTNPEKTFKIVRIGNDVQSGLNLKIEYTK